MGVIKNVFNAATKEFVEENDKNILFEFFWEDQVNNAAKENKIPDKALLRFIFDIWTHQGVGEESSEVIRKLFHDGYCYYLAKMLEDAFPGGYIAWAYPYGHICYMFDGLPYDIEGIYMGEGLLLPYEKLGDTLESYRHRGHDSDLRSEINQFCEEHDCDIVYVYNKVYELIPEDEKLKLEGFNPEMVMVGDAIKHFRRFKDQI